MQREGVFVIINPVAGSCDADTLAELLHQECRQTNLACEIYRTTGDEDVAALVRQAIAQGCQRIIAAGGDGTVAAVASGVLGSSASLAVLPVGTTNALARELQIPLTPADACQLAVHGQTVRALDVMRIGEAIFLSHISLGISSKIAEQAAAADKHRFRQLAYLRHGLPELFSKPSWRFRLEIDGELSYPRASLILIANIGGLGTADVRWGPTIAPDDGQVDVCIVRARSALDYLMLAWYVLRHRHHDAAKLSYMKSSRQIRISAKRRVPVRGDGEIIGQSHVSIEIVPHALPIVTPDT